MERTVTTAVKECVQSDMMQGESIKDWFSQAGGIAAEWITGTKLAASQWRSNDSRSRGSQFQMFVNQIKLLEF